MNFSINTDHEIVAHEKAPSAQDGMILFATEKELRKAIAEWPLSRLIGIWNGFAGAPPFGDLKPVKKFENRAKATRRIWEAIQKLAPELATAKHKTPNPRANPSKPAEATSSDWRAESKARGRAAFEAAIATEKTGTPTAGGKAPREGTAKATVLDMIQRKGGATLEEIAKATGWQKHTIRGFMSVAPKKAGLVVTSTRRESDKARVYEAGRL